MKRSFPHEQAAAIGNGCVDQKLKHQRTCRSTAMDVRTQPWYSELVLPCKHLECITFDVPRDGACSGIVLKHSKRVLTLLFAKHDPCIFKIGFTHKPSWRWENQLYGYGKSVDRWTNMVVMYVSHEPHSAAMLEAALIDIYSSDSALLLVVSFTLRFCFAQANIDVYIRLAIGNMNPYEPTQ